MSDVLFDNETGEITEPEGQCPHCEQSRRNLIQAEQDLRLLERDLRKARNEVAKVKAEAGKQQALAAHHKGADAIFRYWVVRCGKRDKTTVFGEKRQRAVLSALEGHDHAYIARAIDGAAVGAYVSPDGKRYDDLELICRDETKLERFYDTAERTGAPTLVGPAWLKEFGILQDNS